MISVRFACGHRQDVEPAVNEPPQCRECGETRVQAVKAPAPVFRGAAQGPCAGSQ